MFTKFNSLSGKYILISEFITLREINSMRSDIKKSQFCNFIYNEERISIFPQRLYALQVD